MLCLQEELDKRRDRRIELAARKRKREEEAAKIRRTSEEGLIWSWWKVRFISSKFFWIDANGCTTVREG
jgi:hypothetical protein